jgi:hypothetical protein
MSPDFIAGVRAGLEAAARRYDLQTASVERSRSEATDRREIERLTAWINDNNAHAHGLRLMAQQFTADPGGELFAAATAVSAGDRPRS